MHIVNNGGYAYYDSNMGDLEGEPNEQTRHELKVTFILDRVMGTYHQPEDLMNWIAQNSYVDTVSLVEKEE